jgi:hypothetical protein
MSAAAATPVPAAKVRAGRPQSALWPLARVEGRRLLRHPLFLLGMATAITFIVLASGELARHGVPAGASDRTEIVNFLAGDVFVMLGAAFWTFLAAFLAASRERRDAAEDFYAGQPVAAPVRTAATFLSLGYAGLAAFALVAVSALVLVGPDGGLTEGGQRYSVRALELIQGPLYIVMAGALGVLLGSWTRHVFVAVFAAVALFLPPIALVPWFVLDDDTSRGFYGAFVSHAPGLGWRLLAMAGLVALAASVALARTDRRPRLALLGGAGLAAVAAFAIAAPTNGVAFGCAEPDGASASLSARGTSGNLDFERGDLSGWHTRNVGDGVWRAYAAGPPPDQPGPRPNLPDPPQGRFAAVVNPCSPGTRILYRDLEVDGRPTLRFELYYHRYGPRFSAPPSLDHRVSPPNEQLRVDIVDVGAPLLSVAGDDVLANVLQTKPGDPAQLGPRTVSFDLSPWDGRTVRLRFAEVDNDGPVRAVVDDVRLDSSR